MIAKNDLGSIALYEKSGELDNVVNRLSKRSYCSENEERVLREAIKQEGVQGLIDAGNKYLDNKANTMLGYNIFVELDKVYRLSEFKEMREHAQDKLLDAKSTKRKEALTRQACAYFALLESKDFDGLRKLAKIADPSFVRLIKAYLKRQPSMS
jgi:hypothetical protein